MTFQIRSIILYNSDGEIRSLDFKLGRVNIITGRSRTGKTAIGDIIDFCLGRSEYNIPDSDEFNSVSWFGVMFTNKTNDIFVAKPRPEIGVETQSNGYIAQGQNLNIPLYDELTLNTNDDEIVKTLSSMIGIYPNINIPDEGESRIPLEANIKHTKYYLFQSQNLITDKTMLFYRQNEAFMPQAIKDTMPYLLGAVPDDYLIIINDLRKARKKYNQAKRDFEEADAITSNRLFRGQALYKEAYSVGLIASSDVPITPSEVMTELRATQKWQPDNIIVNPNDVSSDINGEVQTLVAKSQEIDRKIKLVKVHQKTFGGFSNEAHEQVSRLKSIELFGEGPDDNKTCPVCGEFLKIPAPSVETISSSLESLKKRIEKVEIEQPRLIDYIEDLEEKKAKVQSEIDLLLLQLKSVYEEEENLRKLRDQNAVIAKVVGRISLYLDTVLLTDDIGILKENLEKARKEIDLVLEKLNDIDKDEALQSIINSISQTITNIAEQLDIEHVEDRFRFSHNKLTVFADRPGATIPMRRIGSAENWLGLHISTLLGFHKYFVDNNRPVPRFIVLDQPSQVYFASEGDYLAYRSLEGRVEDMENVEHDAAKVSRLFNFLFRFCEDMGNEFQIIVTEHANLAEDKFQNALVEEPWTDGRALIPEYWNPPETGV